MIRKEQDREIEKRKNMRGGPGEVTIRHYFRKDEMTAACRLCAELVIPPGAGIGTHEHSEEDEVYIVQKGTGVITCDGKDAEVREGDSVLTGKGGTHSVRNTGMEDLVITAVIMRY